MDPISHTQPFTPPSEGEGKRKRKRKVEAADKEKGSEQKQKRKRQVRIDPVNDEGNIPQQEGEIPQTEGEGNIPHQEGENTPQPSREGEIPQSEGEHPPSMEQQRELPNSSRGRKRMRPLKFLLAMTTTMFSAQRVPGELFSSEALSDSNQGKSLNENRGPIYAYKSISDPDTMYLHQAMREQDRDEFLKAMDKEVDDQMENGNFRIVPMSTIPKGKLILPAVWQMKRKRDIRTREIKKWKARLNLDGSKMKAGEHYDQTYAPVASWNSIRALMVLSIKNDWYTVQLDYVQAFPQAPVERELYMKIPKGYNIKSKSSRDYALKVEKNVYGQKQSGRVWNKYLVARLEKVGFKQSKVDECIFYRGRAIYLLYTDDSILAAPTKGEADKVIADLTNVGLNLTEEGDIKDFLGVNVEKKEDGTIHLTQPHLVDQILKDLKFRESTEPKSTPASPSVILGRYADSEDFDGSFHYASIIGKLNYLERATRPDIAYATHQCARFSKNPKIQHGKAVRYLARYLQGTRDKGLILKPDDSGDLTMHVDADFVGNWDPKNTEDRDTARSRHGYVISYSGCPIIWKSQLQTEVCLSSCESEYTGLSYGLRDVIPVMRLLKEMREFGIKIETSKAEVHCRVFEDNSGALEMARIHKYRPRTKHLHVKLHHFRDYVERKEISIHKISTDQQPADFLTKPLSYEAFIRHRKTVMGW